MRKLALHWQILLGIVLGLLIGFFAVQFGWKTFIVNWVKPFGTIFINLLKLIAIPLIITSLITGVTQLKDISKFSKIGIRTIGLYLITTVTAVTLGLILVNIMKPSSGISETTRQELLTNYAGVTSGKIELATESKESGPLQPLVDIVPGNIFEALTGNSNMLQVIFFVIFLGIGLILIKEEEAVPVIRFFKGMNEVIMKLVDLIMMAAPVGVLSLMASLVVESPSVDLFQALLWYCLTVILGLVILIFGFYPLLVRVFAKRSYSFFLKGMAPAQLLAFSTSSSAATLPVTIERVEEHLGVESEVASFVLPVGATVNMDGTSLYQAVAAVFIANTLGVELSMNQQMTIVLTATLASIGSAAVPGAGMVMLVIVLSAIGVPEAGLALIFAVDRPLDMLRTVANVTSDAAVAMMVGSSLGLLKDRPAEKNWDDNYRDSSVN
ncbi:MAG: dicarboxylate/amino acid:cation symporter [Saprospiraceae bacterium]|nr:dicarboxylate/amino acid:cation symporter [Saprospiraceae bacterium]